MMEKIKKYILTHKVVSGVVLVVLFVAVYYTYGKFHSTTTTTQYVFGKVQRGDLVVTVSGTGQVSTLSKVDIKPQTTGQTQTLGQIIKVNVINGQMAKAGDVIAVLDGKTALQAVNQARSSVASAQANYDKLVNGPTSSDLQSYKTAVQNALQGISTALQNAYITNSNSVYLSTDPFFTDSVVNATLSIDGTYFTDQQRESQIDNERRAVIVPALDLLKVDATNVLTSTDPVALTNDAIAKLTTIRTYFEDMTTLFTTYTTSISDAGLASINTDKSTASTARSSANSAINSMISALQTYQSAVDSLTLKVTPPNPDDVIVVKAQLDNANANLSTAEQTYASRIITAPFDGQIGGLTAQIGQQVSSSDVLGTIITAQKVVNVSLNEVDAAKVMAGDSVSLTFDALPNLTLSGTVSYLDPLGTVSQGVVNYAVQIMINDQNGQLKTGMTATAIITTETHSNVLMVPTAAVTKVGNRSTVLVPNSPVAVATSTVPTNGFNSKNFAGFASSTSTSTASSTATSTRFRGNGTRTFGGATGTGMTVAQAVTATVHPVPVVVGISSDTNTEIISGLSEGDTIVIRTVTGTATAATTAATTARTGSIFGVGGTGGGGGAVRTGGGGGGGGGRVGG